MATGGFVAYYRVSTSKQGASGLGLEAQREAVQQYLNGGRWTIHAEFTEVESGRKKDRPELAKALAAARLYKVPLIVAKLDRLSRNVAFLSTLKDSGVRFVAADMPDANDLTIHVLAAVAQHEREAISQRTKAALAAAAKRRKKEGLPPLGGVRRGQRLTNATRRAGRAAVAERVAERANDLRPTLDALREVGVTTLGGIARELTARGVPTARGGVVWSAVQVARVLDQLSRSQDSP
jgi:DNA invertase Pin-like site-specific DNA recombinase